MFERKHQYLSHIRTYITWVHICSPVRCTKALMEGLGHIYFMWLTEQRHSTLKELMSPVSKAFLLVVLFFFKISFFKPQSAQLCLRDVVGSNSMSFSVYGVILLVQYCHLWSFATKSTLTWLGSLEKYLHSFTDSEVLKMAVKLMPCRHMVQYWALVAVTCSSCVCSGFLQGLQFPPSQNMPVGGSVMLNCPCE